VQRTAGSSYPFQRLVALRARLLDAVPVPLTSCTHTHREIGSFKHPQHLSHKHQQQHLTLTESLKHPQHLQHTHISTHYTQTATSTASHGVNNTWSTASHSHTHTERTLTLVVRGVILRLGHFWSVSANRKTAVRTSSLELTHRTLTPASAELQWETTLAIELTC